MPPLSKTSLYYYLSEYLEDLRRAGVRDIYYPRPLNGAQNGQGAQNQPTMRNESNERGLSNAQDVPDVQTPNARPNQTQRLDVVHAPFEAEPLSADDDKDREKRLAELAKQVACCELCPQLVANRTKTVFGSGDPYAKLCFVGEGPGAEEDLRGLPFVGRSGQLLTDMIEKGMGIKRSSVYICNVVRCRPPKNRNPERAEANACRPFLDATLEIVRPQFICCLGSIAATNLLQTDEPIGRLRGTVHDYRGAKVVCTYHPAYLLRNPAAKKQAWEDLKLLMREMGLPLAKTR